MTGIQLNFIVISGAIVHRFLREDLEDLARIFRKHARYVLLFFQVGINIFQIFLSGSSRERILPKTPLLKLSRSWT